MARDPGRNKEIIAFYFYKNIEIYLEEQSVHVGNTFVVVTDFQTGKRQMVLSSYCSPNKNYT